MNANTVKCRNCQHHSTQINDCEIWFNKIRDPESTTVCTTTLWHELNGKILFDEADTPRQCKHFSGGYSFTVEE